MQAKDLPLFKTKDSQTTVIQTRDAPSNKSMKSQTEEKELLKEKENELNL